MKASLIKSLYQQVGGFCANWYCYGISSAWFVAPFYFFRQLVRGEILEKNTSNLKNQNEMILPNNEMLKNISNDFVVMTISNKIMDYITELALQQSINLDPYLSGAIRTACIGTLYRIVNNQPILEFESIANDFFNGYLRALAITKNINELRTIFGYADNEIDASLLATGGVAGEAVLHYFKNSISPNNIVTAASEFNHFLDPFGFKLP